MQHTPVSQGDADAAFACLAGFERLVLAVSGGPDSLALLFLVAEWKARGGTTAQVSVVTIDHALRPEAAAEAAFVSERSARLGFPHATLKWVHGEKISSGLAEAARQARYGLLETHAAALLPKVRTAVVTAHTEHDQAETFLMRLARGSGIDGLASMARVRPLSPNSEIELVRPFLIFPKSRLIALLEARSETWCNDPTNSNDAYERVRLRAVLETLSGAGIRVDALGRSARRLGSARDALSYASREFERTLSLSLNNNIFASLDRGAFSQGPRLLRERVIAGLIGSHGGETPPPELLEIEALVTALETRERGMATLGGAVISVGPRVIRIWREEGRIGKDDLRLSPGSRHLWDNRFWVTTDTVLEHPVSVRALGKAGYKLVNETGPVKEHLPARAVHALPAFWSGNNLLAVPQLGLCNLQNGGQGTFASIPK